MGRDLYAIPTYSTHAGSRLARDAERKRRERAAQHERQPQLPQAHQIHERRQGNGANEPGSLPRDHINHRICGGPTSRLCFTYNQYDALAKRYLGATPQDTEVALNKFHAHVLAQIPEGTFAGDMLWLLKHFDAWMAETGQVAPAPSKKKPKQDIDLVAMEREINAEKAAKAERARARR